MRILFTFVGGSGHFEPLVPVARAAETAGHTIAFGCGPSMAATVEGAGFTTFTLGTSAGGAPERLPLRPLDVEREAQEFRDRFARDGAQYRAPHTLALCAKWQPEILVCDETDFGGMVAAERLGLPYATVLVIASGSFVRKALIAEPLRALRVEHGLPPDPDLTMLSRYLVLSPFPPRFRDPAYPLPVTAHSFRPFTLDSARDEIAPAWGARLDDKPTVYFTLGTIFNMESGDLFQRVLAGLRALPINLIVTVGRDIDPEEFGPQPAHIHMERYIPQLAVLLHCDLVVSHGGSGSVMGALAHGLPMVLIPMGADQPLNAARCIQLGVARMLDPIAATPDAVDESVAAVLADPNYRQAAERMRDEIAALPGPAHAVTLLERLAAEKQLLCST
ncbi:MAG: glycosyltransferase [Anaerolineales bacterium]